MQHVFKKVVCQISLQFFFQERNKSVLIKVICFVLFCSLSMIVNSFYALTFLICVTLHVSETQFVQSYYK